MKKKDITIIFLICIFLYSCRGEKIYQDENINLSSNNSITLSFPDIDNENEENIINESEIENDEVLDYKNYYETLEYKLKFDYDTLINDYKIQIKIIETFGDDDNMLCWVYMSLEKENKRYIFSPPVFYFSKSDFDKLSNAKKKTLKYKIPQTPYHKNNELGHFGNVPFAFFDIDFDGEKELIFRHPTIGQRLSNGYIAYKIPQEVNEEFEQVTIYENIRQSKVFPILDDYTEFDFKNKNIIIKNIGGFNDYSEEIYSVKDGQLTKIK